MTKNYFALFLLFSLCSYAQVFRHPAMYARPNKSVSISSIEILKNSIKVDIEYLVSNLDASGSYNISDRTLLKTDDDISAKLINAKGIFIAPQMSYAKPGEKKRFTLYFEKIENLQNKRLSLIENPSSSTAFNFYGIELNDNLNINPKYLPKNDFFLRGIPKDLHFLFYNELIFYSKNDLKELFNKLIEFSYDNPFPGIDEIATEEVPPFNVYNIISKNNDIVNSSAYYFLQKEDGSKVDGVMFYIKGEKYADEFFRSICGWYNADIRDDVGIYVKMNPNGPLYVSFEKKKISEKLYTITLSTRNAE